MIHIPHGTLTALVLILTAHKSRKRGPNAIKHNCVNKFYQPYLYCDS